MKFEDDKFYLVLLDPRYIDFSYLETIEIPNEAELLFLAYPDNIGYKQIIFDKVEAIENWLRVMKEERERENEHHSNDNSPQDPTV